jgi:hypothetical protein
VKRRIPLLTPKMLRASGMALFLVRLLSTGMVSLLGSSTPGQDLIQLPQLSHKQQVDCKVGRASSVVVFPRLRNGFRICGLTAACLSYGAQGVYLDSNLNKA